MRRPGAGALRGAAAPPDLAGHASGRGRRAYYAPGSQRFRTDRSPSWGRRGASADDDNSRGGELAGRNAEALERVLRASRQGLDAIGTDADRQRRADALAHIEGYTALLREPTHQVMRDARPLQLQARLPGRPLVDRREAADRPAERGRRRRLRGLRRLADRGAAAGRGSPRRQGAALVLRLRARRVTKSALRQTEETCISSASPARWSSPRTRCPAATRRCPSPPGTRCSATRSPRPSPTASRRPSSDWAASGAPSASSGAHPASTRPPSATPAATRRTRPTKRSARAAPVTPRRCSSSSTRSETSYEEILRLFWEGHDPTQGMRQGNDAGTQYRSAIYTTTDAQRAAAEASRDDVPGRAREGGLRRDHDRDRRGRAVLLRGAVPPAVPREEPERLLRARRHGRLLPDRARRLRPSN